MDDFSAHDARTLMKKVDEKELGLIITDIKIQAKFDKSELHINKTLYNSTIAELRIRGFTVINAPSIATQKDGLYYIISW